MTGIRDMALHLVACKVMADRIKQFSGEGRATAAQVMEPGERIVAKLGGEVVGNVQIIAGRTTSHVTDDPALLAWVRANRPEEIRETISPLLRAQILGDAASAGQAIDPATGEIIPGVTVRQGESYARVSAADGSEAAIAAAWADGRIELPRVVPEIEQ